MLTQSRQATSAFQFGNPDNSRRCVLVHGFAGSPWDLLPLGEALERDGFSGRAPLLPGHGGDPGRMLGVSVDDWLWGAEQAFQEEVLAAHGPVHLLGFSMGALLATLLAARRAAQVKSLVLLAPAARLQGWDVRVARRLRHFSRVFTWAPLLPKGTPDLEDAQVRAHAPSPSHVPATSLRQLFLLQDLAGAEAPRVKAPVQLIVATHDHVVSDRAAREFHARMPGAQDVVSLPSGFHGLARDRSSAKLARTVIAFFHQHR